MSLDVSFGPPSYAPILSLDDDSHYWFLYPWFERLREETGQYIDLYGDATFAGPDLDALGRVLADVREAVEAEPGVPTRRAEFIHLLTLFQAAVGHAAENGWPIECFGD